MAIFKSKMAIFGPKMAILGVQCVISTNIIHRLLQTDETRVSGTTFQGPLDKNIFKKIHGHFEIYNGRF